MQNDLIDYWGIIFSFAILLFSWILFWGYTSDFFFSFLAAVLAAGLAWLAYIVIKMVVLIFYR